MSSCLCLAGHCVPQGARERSLGRFLSTLGSHSTGRGRFQADVRALCPERSTMAQETQLDRQPLTTHLNIEPAVMCLLWNLVCLHVSGRVSLCQWCVTARPERRDDQSFTSFLLAGLLHADEAFSCL